MFSELQYPHWMMITGGLRVLFGFIGLAFSKIRIARRPMKRTHTTSRTKAKIRAPHRRGERKKQPSQAALPLESFWQDGGNRHDIQHSSGLISNQRLPALSGSPP